MIGGRRFIKSIEGGWLTTQTLKICLDAASNSLTKVKTVAWGIKKGF